MLYSGHASAAVDATSCKCCPGGHGLNLLLEEAQELQVHSALQEC